MKGMRSAEEMADEVALDAVEVTATVGPAAQLGGIRHHRAPHCGATADPLSAGLRVMNWFARPRRPPGWTARPALCRALRRSGRRATFRRKAFPRITPS